MSVITISRQFGAGGITLGNMLAKKLDYIFLDNEIIQQVAHKARVSTNWVESIEKQAGGKLLRFITSVVSKKLIDQVLDNERGYIDEEIYVDLLHQIITKIADEGNAIILGRGGQYILKDRDDVFHILLIAHKDDRIKFMEKNYKLTPDQALGAVNREDKRRVNLYRKFGTLTYDQPGHYHIVLNTSRLGLDEAARVICGLVGPCE